MRRSWLGWVDWIRTYSIRSNTRASKRCPISCKSSYETTWFASESISFDAATRRAPSGLCSAKSSHSVRLLRTLHLKESRNQSDQHQLLYPYGLCGEATQPWGSSPKRAREQLSEDHSELLAMIEPSMQVTDAMTKRIKELDKERSSNLHRP